MGTISIIFGLNRPGVEPTTSKCQGQHCTTRTPRWSVKPRRHLVVWLDNVQRYKLPLWSSTSRHQQINQNIKIQISIFTTLADAKVERHGVIELPVKFSCEFLSWSDSWTFTESELRRQPFQADISTLSKLHKSKKEKLFWSAPSIFLDRFIQSHWVRRLQQQLDHIWWK